MIKKQQLLFNVGREVQRKVEVLTDTLYKASSDSDVCRKHLVSYRDLGLFDFEHTSITRKYFVKAASRYSGYFYFKDNSQVTKQLKSYFTEMQNDLSKISNMFVELGKEK